MIFIAGVELAQIADRVEALSTYRNVLGLHRDIRKIATELRSLSNQGEALGTVDEAAAMHLDAYLSREHGVCVGKQAMVAAITAAGLTQPAKLWMSMDSAPTNGAGILALLPDSNFPVGIRFDDGRWCVAWDNHPLGEFDQPRLWMRIPDEDATTLTAPPTSIGVPEGWALVPRVLPIEMDIAFCEAWFSRKRAIDDSEMQDAWDAALVAAPQPDAELRIFPQQQGKTGAVPPSLDIVRQKLQRFADCAEDSAECDIGRKWFDALTTIGLLERTQRSPAWWTMTLAGHDLLTAPPTTAQHAGPAVSGICGDLVEMGDDEEGQPRLIIRTTREAIKAHAGNLLFKQVTVSGGDSCPAADVLHIARCESLDPIYCYFEDFAPGVGRITIACFGDAWTGAWSGMGDRTVRQFVSESDSHYLASSLLQLRGANKQMRNYTARIAAAVIAALTVPKTQEDEP